MSLTIHSLIFSSLILASASCERNFYQVTCPGWLLQPAQVGYCQLSMRGRACLPLGSGETRSHYPVPPMRIEPLLKDPQLCPVHHLVSLEKTAQVWVIEDIPDLFQRIFRISSIGYSGSFPEDILDLFQRIFWISSRNPHSAVSPQTMCRWLKKFWHLCWNSQRNQIGWCLNCCTSQHGHQENVENCRLADNFNFITETLF